MQDERFDSGDLDNIRELRLSPGWQLVQRRLNEELERQRVALEQPGTPADLSRGQVMGLRTALGIPEILEYEIGSQVKE